jgi:integrating conjugative element protein (TIGR03752 family)
VDISSNKLLPLLGTGVVALILAVAFKSCSQLTPAPVEATAKKAAPADADTPADTMNALQAEVAAMRLEAEHLRKNIDAEGQRKNQLSNEITNQVKEELRREQSSQGNNGFEALLKRVDDLSNQYSQANPTGPGAKLNGGSIDPDFSLGGTPEVIRVEPLNAASLLDKLGSAASGLKDKAAEALPSADGSLLHAMGDNSIIKSHLPGVGGSNAGTNPVALPEPAYTVPRNSTLVGSTGMTALIGRIPIKGNVDDPYPFKVIVGSDNLAANGLEIPGVDGMVFTGNALGDWTLSCVRGEIHSVTFVFEDGTIRTLSTDDQSLQQKSQQSAQASGQGGAAQGNNRNGNKALGWISDWRGIPCITGARITNAPQYLGGRFLARAIGAAGEAYARSQTTVNNTPLGGITQGVTGNPQSYALGSLASGGADELADWIAERQTQNYDAVFVDTGAELAVHVDRELPIDFEPHGRKLSYARKKHGAPRQVAALD